MVSVGLFVMQHLRVAAASVSVAASFVAGLFAHHEPTSAIPAPVQIVPPSCERALIQGAHLVSLSTDGASQLLDVVSSEPSRSLDLLDRYGRTLSQLNQRLPAYAADFKLCERRTA